VNSIFEEVSSPQTTHSVHRRHKNSTTADIDGMEDEEILIEEKTKKLTKTTKRYETRSEVQVEVGAPPPPPMPQSSADQGQRPVINSTLLDSIKAGVKLNKVAVEERRKNQESRTGRMQGLMDMFMSAMKDRREDIENEDDVVNEDINTWSESE